MENKKYVDVSQSAGKAFFAGASGESIVMLNLLKFKEVADYSKSKELAPANKISGKEAYKLYMKHTLPFLKEANGEVLFYGESGAFLIGPESENWDVVLLVKHRNKAVFMEFAMNKEYQKGLGHRTAALEDSRLLPIKEF